MKLKVYLINENDDEILDLLGEIKLRLIDLDLKVENLMAKATELKTELATANEITNELAADIANLVSKIGTGMSETEAEEVKTELLALNEKLRGVASVHTPVV